MKKLTLAFAALAIISLMSLASAPARAAGFGLYISSGHAYPSYYNVGYGAALDYHEDAWHDTSHLHYRPGRLIRHGSHWHYQPGRYVIHQTGHWDHVHW